MVYHACKIGVHDWGLHVDASVEDNTWFAPLVYIFFIMGAELIPITAQLISFTFVMPKDSLNNILDNTLNERGSLSAFDNFIDPQ